MGKATKFFSINEAVANNSLGTCSDPTNGDAFVKIMDDAGDMIWVTKAYAILDEFEFEHVDSSSSADNIDDKTQWVIDLLDNDDNVDNQVPLNVPDGLVAKSIKFKIQRLEDDQLSLLKGVTDQSQFLNDIGFNDGGGKKVRPSVFLQGSIQDTTGCHTYRFVADGRFRTRVPFGTKTFDPDSVKAVLQFDIKQAFTDSGITVSNLAGELGFQSTDKQLPSDADYLDGRTKDPKTGSPNAVLWAKSLMASWELFTQPLSSSATLDSNATNITTEDNPTKCDDDSEKNCVV